MPLTGGARLDGFNATWPFARLSASDQALTLVVAVSRTYRFPAERVLTVRKYGRLPFVGWGIQIQHTIQDFPQKVIFWYPGFPATVLTFVHNAGFPKEKIELIHIAR